MNSLDCNTNLNVYVLKNIESVKFKNLCCVESSLSRLQSQTDLMVWNPNGRWKIR